MRASAQEKSTWSVAEAKQRLSALLRDSVRAPQKIYNRSRLVGVVVDPLSFEKFAAWRKQYEAGNIAEALSELRSICAEDGYRLRVPRRRNRANAFLGALR